MQIRIWKGQHGPFISELIQKTWKGNDLLILCPPQGDEDFSFLQHLPNGEVEFVGSWEKTPNVTVRSQIVYPEQPVFGIFSTGTLGKKLVLYSKKNIESSLSAILSLFQSRAYSKVFCYPQPFHTFGLILGYCHAMLYYKDLIVPEGKYSACAHEHWLAINERSVLTLGTPTHFKDLIQYVQNKAQTPRATYSSIIGAAKVEKKLWQACRDILKIQSPSVGYGATEASPGITHLAPGREPVEDGEVGQFLPHIQVELFPKEGLEFSGPAVCLATIQNNTLEFPNSIFIKDVLEKRDDGVLVYKGRAELVLNRGGEKFALEEIESYLKEKMQIDSVCFTLPHPRLGEELGIVTKTSNSRRDEIYETLKDRYGRDFDKDFYETTHEFPVNSSHKIDRTECKRWVEKKLAIATSNN